MAAIFFGYGGYVLGNFYPLIKRKKDKNKQTILIEHEVLQEDVVEEEGAEKRKETKSEVKLKQILPANLDPSETIQIWYDKKKRLIVPQINGDILDLDNQISDDENQILTWFLIDLQEKVGIASNYGSKDEGDQEAKRSVEIVEDNGRNPIRSFVNYIQSDVPKIEEKELSIPEQVNNILQGQIKDSALASKGISVIELPKKRVVFMVGLDLYEDIDEIPGKRIQKAIKIAVKTWEENLNSEN